MFFWLRFLLLIFYAYYVVPNYYIMYQIKIINLHIIGIQKFFYNCKFNCKQKKNNSRFFKICEYG